MPLCQMNHFLSKGDCRYSWYR